MTIVCAYARANSRSKYVLCDIESLYELYTQCDFSLIYMLNYKQGWETLVKHRQQWSHFVVVDYKFTTEICASQAGYDLKLCIDPMILSVIFFHFLFSSLMRIEGFFMSSGVEDYGLHF